MLDIYSLFSSTHCLVSALPTLTVLFQYDAIAVIAVIVGATELVCVTVDQVMEQLKAGSTLRHISITKVNERSSRSHSIFIMVISEYICLLSYIF